MISKAVFLIETRFSYLFFPSISSAISSRCSTTSKLLGKKDKFRFFEACSLASLYSFANPKYSSRAASSATFFLETLDITLNYTVIGVRIRALIYVLPHGVDLLPSGLGYKRHLRAYQAPFRGQVGRKKGFLIFLVQLLS